MSGQALAGDAGGGSGGGAGGGISSRGAGMGSPQPCGDFAFALRVGPASHWKRQDGSCGRGGRSSSICSSGSSSSMSVWRWFGYSPQQRRSRRQRSANPEAGPDYSAVERGTAAAAAAVGSSQATEFVLQHQRHGVVAAEPGPNHGGLGGGRAAGMESPSAGADGREQQRQRQGEGLSLSAAARRRRRELELSWLEDPGRDMPFEFADLHEVRPDLSCSVPAAQHSGMAPVCCSGKGPPSSITPLKSEGKGAVP